MKIAVVLSGYFGTISANDMQSGIKSHKKITNFFKDYDVDYIVALTGDTKISSLKGILDITKIDSRL